MEFENKFYEITSKYSDVLSMLSSTTRVIDLETYNNDVVLTEGCDQFFSAKLSKQDCKDLSDLFAELSGIAPEIANNNHWTD